MARPRPRPGSCRRVAFGARAKGTKSVAAALGGKADPLVAHAECDTPSFRRHRQGDNPAIGRIFRGVVEQVPEDLFEAVGVAQHHAGVRRGVHQQPVAHTEGGAVVLGHRGGQRREVERAGLERQLPGAQARYI